MNNIKQNEESAPVLQRVKNLEALLLDPKSDCYLEGLLDVVTCLAEDTRQLAKIKSNRLLNNVHEKFKIPAKFIAENRLCLTDFDCIKRIGKGAFGEVQLVRHGTTRQVFALKILSKSKVLEQPGSANFWEERDIMAKSQSDWIVKMFYAMQDLDNLYMIMEYVPGGNLNQWIDMGEDMSEDDAMFYIAETILGLEVLHGLMFIHRDIKPSNLLLDRSGHVKLADFGAAIRMDPATRRAKPNTAVGTPDYLSPEVLKCQGNDNASIGPEVDWWAVGVMIYELVFSELPFYTESLAQTYNMIMNHKQYLQFPDSPDVPKKTLDLIKCLIVDADVRLGRNGAQEIKQHPCFQGRSWKWDTIQHCLPPFVPQLNGDADTSRFDMEDDDGSDSDGRTTKRREADAEAMKRLTSRGATIKPFTGEQLSFAGFTFIDPQFSLFNGSQEVAPKNHTENGNSHDFSSAKWEAERKRFTNEIQDLLSQLEEMSTEQDTIMKEKKNIFAMKSKLELENEDLRRDMTSAKVSEKEQRQRCEELQEKLERQHQDIRELQTDKAALETKLNSAKNQISEYQKTEEQSKIDTDELRHRLLTTQQDKEAMQQQLTSQRIVCTDLQKQLSDVNCELLSLQGIHERTKKEMFDKRDKEQLDKRLQDERHLKENLEAKVLTLEKHCQRLELDLERSNQALHETKAMEEDARKEIARLQRDNDQLQRAHQSALASLHTERERLKENLDSEMNFKEIYRHQMEERDDQCKELEENLGHLRKEYERITKDLEANRETINGQKEAILLYEEKVQTEAELHKRIQRQQADAQKKEITAIEEALMEQQLKNRGFQQQCNDLKNEIEKKEFEINKLSKDLDLAVKMKEAAINKLKEVIGNQVVHPSKFPFHQPAPTGVKVKNLQNEKKKLQSRLENQVKEHKQRMDEMSEACTALELARDELQKQLDHSMQQIEELTRTNQHLQNQLYNNSKQNFVAAPEPNATLPPTVGGSIPFTPSNPSTQPMPTLALEDDIDHMEGGLDIVAGDKPGDDAFSKERKKKRQKIAWESKYGQIIVGNENCLAFFDLSNDTKPILQINLDQIMHVRPASQADVLHVDKKDLPRIFQLIVDLDSQQIGPGDQTDLQNSLYGSSHSVDALESTQISTGSSLASIFTSPFNHSKRFHGGEQSNALNRRTSLNKGNVSLNSPAPSASSSAVGTLNLDKNYKHHKFQDMYFRSRAVCQICQRSLNSVLNPSLSLQCLHCHLKICPSHVEIGGKSSRSSAIPPCGSQVHIYLIRAPSIRMCERWVQVLNIWVKRKMDIMSMSLLPRNCGLMASAYSVGNKNYMALKSATLMSPSTVSSSVVEEKNPAGTNSIRLPAAAAPSPLSTPASPATVVKPTAKEKKSSVV